MTTKKKEETKNRNTTPVAILHEETASLALAWLPKLPEGVDAMIVVRDGVTSDAVLRAIMAVKGTLLSYGLPTTAEGVRRDGVRSTSAVRVIELPLRLVLTEAQASAPAPAAPTKWETPQGERTEREMVLAQRGQADRAKAERLERELAEERERRAKLEAELAKVSADAGAGEGGVEGSRRKRAQAEGTAAS